MGLSDRFTSVLSRKRLGEEETADSGLDPARALRLVTGFEAQGTGWFWETDRTGRLTYLSDGIAAQIAGSAGDAIGRLLTELFEHGSGGDIGERTLVFHLNARTSFSDFEVRLSGEAAGRCWSLSGRPWTDEIGQFRGFVGSGCDLTYRRQSEAEIARLAMFDSLTGLANRARVHLALDQALRARDGQYRATALLLLDLDRFKAVNDTLGHQTGDQLLQQVASRLTRTVPKDGLVGRLGGDEFTIVLPGEGDRERLAELGRRVIATLSQPYGIAGSNIAIGCSIGIAVAPLHGGTTEALIRNADLALYAAKAGGRGVHRFYDPSLLEQARARKVLEDDLRQALAAEQLRLVYQPVVSTASERIEGYEALLRWEHPVRGAISPADFIPVAEESGLIEQIGEWVLRTACHDAARWPRPVRVAVNVSPIQFGRQSLPALVTSALAAAALDPARLELEITEGVFLDESAFTQRMFESLKALGVRLVLDDFGTGYSSLGYLKTAPFDKIKIDQSFVRGAKEEGSRNAAIIKAIVTLADALNLETTAEGVEAQDAVAFIRMLGCTHIQGFVYGQPVAADEVAGQLAGGAAEPVGVRVTRARRISMLRSVAMVRGTTRGVGRVRNISESGAMIDSVLGFHLATGDELAIELVEGEPWRAVVVWIADDRVGLRFARPFALEQLSAPGRARPGVRR